MLRRGGGGRSTKTGWVPCSMTHVQCRAFSAVLFCDLLVLVMVFVKGECGVRKDRGRGGGGGRQRGRRCNFVGESRLSLSVPLLIIAAFCHSGLHSAASTSSEGSYQPLKVRHRMKNAIKSVRNTTLPSVRQHVCGWSTTSSGIFINHMALLCGLQRPSGAPSLPQHGLFQPLLLCMGDSPSQLGLRGEQRVDASIFGGSARSTIGKLGTSKVQTPRLHCLMGSKRRGAPRKAVFSRTRART